MWARAIKGPAATEEWTVEETPTDGVTYDIAGATSRSATATRGAESGQVFEYGAGGWNEETTEMGQNLRAVETGGPNVSVGDPGTVITD